MAHDVEHAFLAAVDPSNSFGDLLKHRQVEQDHDEKKLIGLFTHESHHLLIGEGEFTLNYQMMREYIGLDEVR